MRLNMHEGLYIIVSEDLIVGIFKGNGVSSALRARRNRTGFREFKLKVFVAGRLLPR